MAQIKGPIYESVQLIDDAFMCAVENYKSSLVIDSTRDIGLQASVILMPELYAGGVGAVEIASDYTPSIPGIAHVCYPILLAFGFFWGVYNQERIVKEKREKEKSIHRLRWASYVSHAEEKRIEESVALAQRRIRVLAEEVTEYDNKGLRNQDAFDELLQLSRVIQAISGNDLTVTHNNNQISVPEFINQFQ
jgi:hypothetical protein